MSDSRSSAARAALRFSKDRGDEDRAERVVRREAMGSALMTSPSFGECGGRTAAQPSP